MNGGRNRRLLRRDIEVHHLNCAGNEVPNLSWSWWRAVVRFHRFRWKSQHDSAAVVENPNWDVKGWGRADRGLKFWFVLCVRQPTRLTSIGGARRLSCGCAMLVRRGAAMSNASAAASMVNENPNAFRRVRLLPDVAESRSTRHRPSGVSVFGCSGSIFLLCIPSMDTPQFWPPQTVQIPRPPLACIRVDCEERALSLSWTPRHPRSSPERSKEFLHAEARCVPRNPSVRGSGPVRGFLSEFIRALPGLGITG